MLKRGRQAIKIDWHLVVTIIDYELCMLPEDKQSRIVRRRAGSRGQSRVTSLQSVLSFGSRKVTVIHIQCSHLVFTGLGWPIWPDIPAYLRVYHLR